MDIGQGYLAGAPCRKTDKLDRRTRMSFIRKRFQRQLSFLARWSQGRLPASLAIYFLTQGIKAEARTMVTRKRLRSLYHLCTRPDLPEGSLVECGVARGGCIAVMAFASAGKRPVWGFDSFEGMPELTPEDGGDGQQWVGLDCSGPDGYEEAQRTLSRFSLSRHKVMLVPGWFEDTLPDNVSHLAPIAVLRLDNDWYRSTRFCLETLYNAVVAEGIVIIDDYHTFTGCRKAVDEFRMNQGIRDTLITTENDTEAYWVKCSGDPREGS